MTFVNDSYYNTDLEEARLLVMYVLLQRIQNLKVSRKKKQTMVV